MSNATVYLGDIIAVDWGIGPLGDILPMCISMYPITIILCLCFLRISCYKFTLP